MKLHQYTKKTIALSLAAVMAVGLAGCRASDEIQKIVYTQEATEVDDTEVTRRWEQEAEEQDDYSDELQEEEDNEENDDEEEMEADQISADETVEETVPEEADETETPNTEEVAQVASAEETGTNQIANDSDEETGSSQVSGSADGGSDVTDSNSEDTQDEDDDTESPASGQASGSSSDSTHASDEEEPDGEEPDEEEPDEEEPDEEEPDESGDSESEGTQQDDEGSTSEEGDNSAGEDTEEPRKQIYDTDGNLIALPDNVSTIVAAGEAALITQMLGGEGVLLGSSSEFLGNTLVRSVFADEGISSVSTLWSGDGSSPMSDESFEELLELNPDCVLEISGETNFSSSQETALKEAQIYIVTLPALTNSTNITAAVETVGQLLDDHAVGGTTSVALAEEYVAYEAELVTEVQSRKGAFNDLLSKTNQEYKAYFTNISNSLSNGDFTMILYDWDDTFSFTYSYNGMTYVSQSGGAVVSRSYSWNPATYYLTVAGVMNTADGSSTTKDYTVYVPFYKFTSSTLTDEDQNQNGVQVSAGMGELGIFATSNIGYTVSGGSETSYGAFSASSSNYMITGYSMWAGLGWTSFTSSSPYYVSGAYAWLGTSRFPYVIAANSDVASKLETETTNSNGLYTTRTWGIEVDGLNYTLFVGSGIQTEQQQLVINRYTTQRQDYDIVINPSGCGDWLTGSVESVLESVWISNLYWGNETYSDLDMEEEILEFYETFYRHSLSGSELNDILDGE